MKRSPSESPSADPSSDISETKPTPKKQRSKAPSESPTKKNNKTKKEEGQEWTPDKKEILIDRLIDYAYKNMDLEAIAKELDLAVTQVRNQLAKGRKGSLREKAAKAARGS